MGGFRSAFSNLGLLLVAGAIGFGAVYLFAQQDGIVEPALAMISGECDIKGNISIGSGERIYHLPGQRYYDETIIRLEYGERWFCSEADAIAAGWRRSGV